MVEQYSEHVGYPYQRYERRVPPANPHRVGHSAGLHPEDAPEWTGEVMPRQTSRRLRYSVEYTPEELEAITMQDVEPKRQRTSALRYRPLETINLQKRPVGLHWLVFLGLALLIMILGWIGLSTVGNWWNTTQDDWHYGRPRTFQIDAVVGHHDTADHPSHFVAINLNRKVMVIEIPGGDASHAQIYLGPTLLGDGQDLTPITLSFQDVNGDGKPDMLIHILDQTVVFFNNGKTFVAPH